jgi:SIR2-like domain
LGDWQGKAILPEPSKGIDLLKLHGSANWKWLDRPGASADITPPRTIQEVSSGEMRERLRNAKLYPNSDYVGESLGVIFGGGNTLTAEGPFIDLFHKFKRLLWKKQHLLVIGYSFRVDHINDIIEHWFATKPQ